MVPSPSGLSQRLIEYLKALEDRYAVDVLSSKTQDVSHIERFLGSRLMRVPVGAGDLSTRMQMFERAVRRQLESDEYALVHCFDPFGGAVLAEMKAQLGYRLVYEATALPSLELPALSARADSERKLYARIRRQELFCLVSAERVVVASQLGSQYVQGLGVNDGSIRVLRAPSDVTLFAAAPPPAPDRTPMRLLYLGNHSPWQGLSTLVRALHVSRRRDVRLTICGPSHPDHTPKLESLIHELGLGDRIAFTVATGEQLSKVLGEHDVGVVPLAQGERNRVQGGALAKVSDYLSAGRPILGADLPITRELCPEDATVFVAPDDADALGTAIAHLATDAPRRKQMGTRARAAALGHVDASDVRAQLLEVYAGLLGAQKPGPRPIPPGQTVLTATPTARVLEREAPREKTEPFIPSPRRGKRTQDTDPSTVIPPRPLAGRHETGEQKRPKLDEADSLQRTDVNRPLPVPSPALPASPPAIPAPAPPPAGAAVISTPLTQLPPALRSAALARHGRTPTVPGEEPMEISPDEIMEFNEVSLVSRVTRIDPWFAQLVHGYCPPDGIQFSRHAPPTTFPGRENAPVAASSEPKPPGG